MMTEAFCESRETGIKRASSLRTSLAELEATQQFDRARQMAGHAAKETVNKIPKPIGIRERKRIMKVTSCPKAENQPVRGAVPCCSITRNWPTLAAALMALASLSAIGGEEKKVTIPAGTSLLVKLDKAVTSSDKPGTKFSGVLQGDLSSGAVVAVKTGSAVIG